MTHETIGSQARMPIDGSAHEHVRMNIPFHKAVHITACGERDGNRDSMLFVAGKLNANVRYVPIDQLGCIPNVVEPPDEYGFDEAELMRVTGALKHQWCSRVGDSHRHRLAFACLLEEKRRTLDRRTAQ